MKQEEFLNLISTYDRIDYFAHFGEIEDQLCAIEKQMEGHSEERKLTLLWDIVQQVSKANPWVQIHILSFAMQVSENAVFAEKLLEVIIGADWDAVGEYGKLSHYWQLRTKVFVKGQLDSPLIQRESKKLYCILEQSFSKVFGLSERQYISKEDRDENLVFVMTAQLLGMGHAPTKTLLDRCYILQKYMNKKVMIINTAMLLPAKGMEPFYKLDESGYRPELTGKKNLEFQGEVFDFYQCDNIMPDLDVIAQLIKLIKEKKPYYLLHIGGSDICADICGKLVPLITVSTVFSRICDSCGQYQIVDKELTTEDKIQLAIMGVLPQDVKRAPFTFSFKPQTNSYTRAQLGLWEDRFILVIVGWRLDDEVNGEFLNMLEALLEKENHIGIAFVGKFDTYEQVVNYYPRVMANSINLGEQSDVLAVLEVCDLYVNPRRNGGGSSVSEALYQGIPAVTLPVGDVSVAAGKEFWVSDYSQMQSAITHYVNDSVYYNDMSQKAKLRASYLMDSKLHFGTVIKEIEADIRNGE